MTVLLGNDDFTARGWSLGGFLHEAAPAVDVGGRIDGQLQVAGSAARHAVRAAAVRRDRKAGTLACRFLEPSEAMVTAFDAAVAGRFLRRRARAGLGAWAFAAVVLAASSASAGGGGMLVPGNAPLPEFRLNFPDPLSEPFGPSSSHGDLQISLTTPGKGVIQFLFSPRSRFAITTDPETGASRSYAGLGWNLFDSDRFFGTLSLAGTLTRPGTDEFYRRSLGPPLALHSTFEFGYQFGDRHSLTLSLDRATTPDFLSERSELDNFTLRYGVKF
ncbi:MAG TPA: hypothetical protein VN802_11685 [Stellaceae bacterium]|nr:hypothetical protein [Stellaceae bacterium]